MARSALEIVTAFFDPSGRADVLARDLEFLPLTGELAFGPEGVEAALGDIAEQFRDYDVSPVARIVRIRSFKTLEAAREAIA